MGIYLFTIALANLLDFTGAEFERISCCEVQSASMPCILRLNEECTRAACCIKGAHTVAGIVDEDLASVVNITGRLNPCPNNEQMHCLKLPGRPIIHIGQAHDCNIPPKVDFVDNWVQIGTWGAALMFIIYIVHNTRDLWQPLLHRRDEEIGPDQTRLLI